VVAIRADVRCSRHTRCGLDLATQKAVCRDMQGLAFQNLPFFPVGQWFISTAHSGNLTGFVKAGFMLFWG
jgi:peptide/nickel transport system substrate-binding protein